MIRILKIEDGIQKVPNTEGNTFLDQRRTITYTSTEDNLGYILFDEINLGVELDQNIILFPCNETEIDGKIFNTSEELKNYIFNV